MSPLLRRNRRLVLLASALMTAAGVAACGDGGTDKKLLSHSASARLTSTLDQVQSLVDEGDCSGAEAETGLLRQQVGALPSRVDVDLRNAVISSANRLERLIASQCTVGTTTPAPSQVQQQQPEENGNEKQKKPKKLKGNEGDQGTSGPAGPEETPPGDDGTTGDGDSGGSGDSTGGDESQGF